MEFDVMKHFGISTRFSEVPYFENEKSKKLIKEEDKFDFINSNKKRAEGFF